jgi:hypothetical protein
MRSGGSRAVDDVALFEQQQGTRHVNAPGELPPPDPAYDDEVARLRKPPHSEEAEQSLLGVLLLEPGALAKVSDLVATPDFYSWTHKLIFDAITAMASERVPVDVISTYERLERDGHAGDVGGLAYLNALVHALPNTSNPRRYAEIIVERATLRTIIANADLVTSRAFKNEAAAEILADMKATTARLAEERKLGRAGVPLLTVGQLREQAHAVSWLVKGTVPADSIGMLYGGSGTFKSFIALDLALHITHGLPWLGRRTKQGSVIYVAAEGGSGLWGRICAWHKARRLSYEKTPLHIVPVALDLTQDAWKIVEAAQAAGVTPELVVIDTLSQTYAGEENSANEVAAYFRELGKRIRELWHCAVMIIHHTGHVATERPRGSSAMRANLDWMLGVHRDEKEMLATLSCAKQKDGEAFKDTTFALTVQDLGTDVDGDMLKSLVARHLSSVEEIQEVMEREGRAGRGGGNQLLMSLLQNGGLESDLRTAFMKQCEQETPEGRRQAYSRARRWALNSGFIEFAQGCVITLKIGDRA